MEVAVQQIEFFGTPVHGHEVTPPGQFEGGVGVYLHGEAEDEVGFDIPNSNVDLFEIEQGIHPVLLDGKPGYTLFLWSHPNLTSLLRGFVVKNSDAQGYAHAQEGYKNRPQFL